MPQRTNKQLKYIAISSTNLKGEYKEIWSLKEAAVDSIQDVGELVAERSQREDVIWAMP